MIKLKHASGGLVMRSRIAKDYANLGISFTGGFELVSGSFDSQVEIADGVYDRNTSPSYFFSGNVEVTGVNAELTSLNADVATIAQDGVVTRVSEGQCRIVAKDGVTLGIDLDLTTKAEAAQVDVYVRPVSGCLSEHVSEQVDSRIDNTMTMNANGNIFSTQDHATPNYVRNSSVWCDVDLTCISPWNSRGANKRAGTLVTKRHVLNAAHYPLLVDDTIRFVESDGTVHTRTVVGAVSHPAYMPHHPDLRLYTLDSDLPDAISPCQVMPSDCDDYAVNNLETRPAALVLDQEEKALVADYRGGGGFLFPINADRLTFSETIVSGDSGNPSFWIVEGRLVLITCWTYGGSGGGTEVCDFIPDVNAMIVTADAQAGVSTGYTVTEADFSNGRDYREGSALHLDGSSGLVTLGVTDKLDGATYIKITVWVKPTAVGAHQGIVSKWLTAGMTRGFIVDIYTGNARLLTGVNSTTSSVIQTPIVAGEWQKIVAVWDMDGGITSISVEGAEVTGTTSLASMQTNTEELLIGCKSDNGVRSSFFGGEVADLVIETNNDVFPIPLNQESGDLAHCANADTPLTGDLESTANFAPSTDLPILANKANREGFTAGIRATATSARIRWNTGTLPSFTMSRVRFSWYQPFAVTSATTGIALLNLADTNGNLALKLGSSTSLATDETLTFNGDLGSTRNYIQEDLSIGWHILELTPHADGDHWDIELDGEAMTTITYSATTNKVFDKLWIGASSNGYDCNNGILFHECKVWDDSDVLRVDAGFETGVAIERVSGIPADTVTSSEFEIIPAVTTKLGQNLIHFSSIETESLSNMGWGGSAINRTTRTQEDGFTKLVRHTVGGSSYINDQANSLCEIGKDYMLELTVKAGAQWDGPFNLGSLQGGWQGDFIEIVSGSGNITNPSGLYVIAGLDENETVIRCKIPYVSGNMTIYMYPFSTGVGTVGDTFYIKNNLHMWEGDENTEKPTYVDTAPNGHTLDEGIESVRLPLEDGDVIKDALGGVAQFTGISFPKY